MRVTGQLQLCVLAVALYPQNLINLIINSIFCNQFRVIKDDTCNSFTRRLFLHSYWLNSLSRLHYNWPGAVGCHAVMTSWDS